MKDVCYLFKENKLDYRRLQTHINNYNNRINI